MNKTKTKIIDRFKAITESGKVFTIDVYQDFTVTDSFGAEPQEIPGFKYFKSSAGKHVNEINENTYEILGGIEKIIVTRI